MARKKLWLVTKTVRWVIEGYETQTEARHDPAVGDDSCADSLEYEVEEY